MDSALALTYLASWHPMKNYLFEIRTRLVRTMNINIFTLLCLIGLVVCILISVDSVVNVCVYTFGFSLSRKIADGILKEHLLHHQSIHAVIGILGQIIISQYTFNSLSKYALNLILLVILFHILQPYNLQYLHQGTQTPAFDSAYLICYFSDL